MPSDVLETDRDLIRLVAEGSSEALGRLYDRHSGVVFGLARRVLRRLEDAEEVVQDVFAQVWREAGRYQEGRASVGGWIVMLTRTRAIDRLRVRSARPDLLAPVNPADAPDPVARDRSPEQASISAEQANTIRAAVLELPDAERKLLEMAFYDGLTHAEIAEQTGTPLGTVKTRVRSAMGRLRGALDALAGEVSGPTFPMSR